MLEVLLCSLFTVVPDYLYRRFRQGKRLGHEITLFSVWYELRYGITACLMLTVGLIAVIFYNHPSTTNVTAVFRAIPIVPETSGRVARIYVDVSGEVTKGSPIFRLDSAKQEAALELAKRQIAEVEAGLAVGQSEIATAEGQVQQAQGSYENAQDELRTKEELSRRNSGIVAQRDIERLQNDVASAKGALAAALAAKQSAETRVSTLLPAQKATAEAALQQAQVELDKMVIKAGVDGRVEQFALKEGDYVNPFMRPAGVLIPKAAGRWALAAGFNQIEGQVLKVGMTAEATCISRPWVIIPMVVTRVQDYIAAGQFRTSDQLVDVQQMSRPGTITVFLEPLYENGLAGVLPGSSCAANAYSNNHERLQSPDIGFGTWLYLHAVDAVGVVHAVMLRLQALRLPITELVLKGH
ncbi:MAG: secretion protein HlyD [Alphaproteobacteria bacterium BRH_c36]|nr:MAG: secretion protein HlyD [Alphaproteobacteria bacterium BRH_c36]